MTEQPEFCAGVRILIERMKTNPEDFDEGEYDPASMYRKNQKFSMVGKWLDELVTNSKAGTSWKEWHFLSKEERTALLEAYKEMRRGQFDKQIMERVFDDKFHEQQSELQMMKLRRMALQPMTTQLSTSEAVMQAAPTGLSALFSGVFK